MSQERRRQFKEGDFHFQSFAVPEYMRGGLDRYINDHVSAGSFLMAILANDYHFAIGLADENNMANLPAFANFLYNSAPSDCHGSKEKVEAWLAMQEGE